MKKLPTTLLLVAAAVGGILAYGARQRSVGELRATIALREAAIDSLSKRAARVDSVYVVRRDTLRIVRTRTDSILDTLRLTDTLVRIETVVQIVERERLACDAVVASCEQRVAVRDSLLGLKDLQLQAERGRDRIFGVKLPSRSASLVIGALACKLFCP